MRQIKFRVWHKKYKEMYEVTCIDWEAEFVWVKYYDDDREEWFSREEHFADLELMQYTGLKDKNGVEIYEGDILFHPLQGKRKVFYPYSETVASYGLQNVDNGMGNTLKDAHRVWEIIGNIYENPEHLEATK